MRLAVPLIVVCLVFLLVTVGVYGFIMFLFGGNPERRQVFGMISVSLFISGLAHNSDSVIVASVHENLQIKDVQWIFLYCLKKPVYFQ